MRAMPVAPSTPALALASDSGTQGDNITNVNVAAFTGTAAAGSTVTILSDGAAVGTTTADANGNFQATVSALADGTHLIAATATDTDVRTDWPKFCGDFSHHRHHQARRAIHPRTGVRIG